MKRVSDIKAKREQRFYDRRQRLSGKRKMATKTALREIRQGIDLIVAPQVRHTVLTNVSDIVKETLGIKTESVEDTPMSTEPTEGVTPNKKNKVTLTPNTKDDNN